MAGFNRDVNIELEDIETDIEDLEDEYEEESYSPNRGGSNKNSSNRGGSQRNGSRRTPPNKKPRNDEESDGEDDGRIIRRKDDKSNDKTVVYIVVGVVVLVLVVGLFFFISSSKKKKEAELLALQQQQEEQQSSSSTESSVEPGIPNFYGVGEEENDDYLYDPSLITKDLNGNQVPTNYTVIDSEEITDYINYKKYRSATGNGLEFYWLEAEYKGQPYKVQVPYSIYSKLDYSGITVVDMEVLTLEDGSKMITYMSVREDAKSLLEQR